MQNKKELRVHYLAAYLTKQELIDSISNYEHQLRNELQDADCCKYYAQTLQDELANRKNLLKDFDKIAELRHDINARQRAKIEQILDEQYI